MDSYTKALASALVRGLLPYPDPRRRRGVRRSARELVACEPWPGDAATGADVAQLALLRVLWLQRQIRRAARTRSHEAAVLLARSSLEATLLGIYCLGQDDVVGRLASANAKATIKMLGYLVDDGVLSKEVLEKTISAIAEPKNAPDLWQMVAAVEKRSGGAGAISLYRRFYVPTSTFFVHANAASLLRHVNADDGLSERPISPWMLRSAVRVGDACVGLLATAIALHAGSEASGLAAYGDDHLKRAFTPVAVMAGKGFRRAVQWRALLPLVREVVKMRRYFATGQAESQPPEATEARLRALFAIYTQAVFDREDTTVPADAFDPLIDYFIEKILADLTASLRERTAAAAEDDTTT